MRISVVLFFSFFFCPILPQRSCFLHHDALASSIGRLLPPRDTKGKHARDIYRKVVFYKLLDKTIKRKNITQKERG